MKNKIKTLDVNGKEHYNGNSYFSVRVTINYGLKSEKTIYVPYQYGYESQYEFIALEELKKQVNKKILKTDTKALWRFCRENNIILRSNMMSDCKESEVINWSIK